MSKPSPDTLLIGVTVLINLVKTFPCFLLFGSLASSICTGEETHLFKLMCTYRIPYLLSVSLSSKGTVSFLGDAQKSSGQLSLGVFAQGEAWARWPPEVLESQPQSLQFPWPSFSCSDVKLWSSHSLPPFQFVWISIAESHKLSWFCFSPTNVLWEVLYSNANLRKSAVQVLMRQSCCR